MSTFMQVEREGSPIGGGGVKARIDLRDVVTNRPHEEELESMRGIGKDFAPQEPICEPQTRVKRRFGNCCTP
jgi:hypothetical protein